MDIPQVSPHHTTASKSSDAKTEKQPILHHKFEGEFLNARNVPGMMRFGSGDTGEIREKQEQVEEKRRNDDQEKAAAMAFWNQQTLENRINELGHLKQQANESKLIEAREKLDTHNFKLKDDMTQKGHFIEKVNENTDARKAHLVTPAVQKNTDVDPRKVEFSEFVARNTEQPEMSPQASKGMKLPDQMLEGEQVKRVVIQNNARSPQDFSLVKDPLNRNDMVKSQTMESGGRNRNGFSHSKLTASIPLEKGATGKNNAAAAKQFNDVLDVSLKTGNKQETQQAAPRAESKPADQSNMKEVINNVRILLNSGKNEVVIRLVPEQLGKLEIRLRKNAGKLTGEFKVENREARELLSSEFVHLKRSLEEQGITMDDFSFIIKGEENAFHAVNQHPGRDDHRSGSDRRGFRSSPGEESSAGENGRGREQVDDSVNIIA